MNRSLRDASLAVSKALPAAAANNYSDFLDLGCPSPGVTMEGFDLLIEVPALPSLVDAKTVIVTVHDSDDGATSAAIPELATLVLTGAGGVGAAAASRRVKLPPSVRQYLRFNSAVLAAGGDNTAVAVAMSLVK